MDILVWPQEVFRSSVHQREDLTFNDMFKVLSQYHDWFKFKLLQQVLESMAKKLDYHNWTLLILEKH